MHIDDIISELSSYLSGIGKPTEVIEFGSGDPPKPPYVVVKQETGAFRLIGHVKPGQQSFLRVLVRKDFQNALLDKTVGSTRLEADPLDTPGSIINTNSDGTISQERLFISADRLY